MVHYSHNVIYIQASYGLRKVLNSYTRTYIKVWNLVADIEGGTQAEGLWE